MKCNFHLYNIRSGGFTHEVGAETDLEKRGVENEQRPTMSLCPENIDECSKQARIASEMLLFNTGPVINKM